MKIKTYAESKGKKPFDWNSFLDKAIAGKVGAKALASAVVRSKSWVTCACGNMCDLIPRKEVGFTQGCPLDDTLASLGVDFFDHVKDGRYKSAKKTLAAIERRSAKLIKVKVDQAIGNLEGNPDFQVLRKVGLI
jgi:hypothetical protein